MKTEIIDGEIIRTGSGNVFADLGHPHPEERLLNVDLTRSHWRSGQPLEDMPRAD